MYRWRYFIKWHFVPKAKCNRSPERPSSSNRDCWTWWPFWFSDQRSVMFCVTGLSAVLHQLFWGKWKKWKKKSRILSFFSTVLAKRGSWDVLLIDFDSFGHTRLLHTNKRTQKKKTLHKIAATWLLKPWFYVLFLVFFIIFYSCVGFLLVLLFWLSASRNIRKIRMKKL